MHKEVTICKKTMEGVMENVRMEPHSTHHTQIVRLAVRRRNHSIILNWFVCLFVW